MYWFILKKQSKKKLFHWFNKSIDNKIDTHFISEQLLCLTLTSVKCNAVGLDSSDHT